MFRTNFYKKSKQIKSIEELATGNSAKHHRKNELEIVVKKIKGQYVRSTYKQLSVWTHSNSLIADYWFVMSCVETVDG